MDAQLETYLFGGAESRSPFSLFLSIYITLLLLLGTYVLMYLSSYYCTLALLVLFSTSILRYLVSRSMATPFIAVAAALLLRSVYAKTTICHSHICNSPPSSVVTSILADVSQLATIHLTSEQDGLLEIDASFSRLDDESITSLVDGLLMQLHEQPADENTVKLHLRLSMNKLTPGGASKLFERLIADRVKSQDVDSSADTLAIQNVTVELTDIETDVSVNETISDEANTATNDQDEEEDVTPQNIELEKLDLSLNDIGGHGCNPANLAMLNSVRMMFEQGRRNVLVPRVLSLENCGAGPAFCRSIGRVRAR